MTRAPHFLYLLTLQGRLFVTMLGSLDEALSVLYDPPSSSAAASCDRAAPGEALKAAPSVQPPSPSSAGCPPLEAAPMQQLVDQRPPSAPGASSSSTPTPSLSLADIKRDVLRRSGKGWEDHLQIIRGANCSCQAEGYSESCIKELDDTWGDGSACSGLPSPMDVPTLSQAAARESAAEVLRALRQAAGLVWPEHPAAAAAGCSGLQDPASSYADWEVLQAELLASSPPSEAEAASTSASAVSWGEALWCFNPSCTNLEGPSELALKTLPCGGGCGVRYCSTACQVQGWRDGHRLSCGRLSEWKRAARK